MSDYSRSDVGAGYNSASNINTELNKVEVAISTKLDSDGGFLTADIDANSQRLLNLPDGTQVGHSVNYGQLINRAAFQQADAKFYDSIALWQADTTSEAGDVVIIKERDRSTFDVITGTGTANTFNVIAHGTLSLSIDLWIGDTVTASSFGIDIDADNNSPVIQAAYDYAKDNKKDFDLPGGVLKCTETLNFDGLGMNTRGVGSSSTRQTVILVDHNNGPGIHISAGRQTLSYLRVKGGNDRQIAAPDIADCGILIEPADTPATLMSQVGLDWVLVDDHNGSGIVANQITGLTMEQTVVTDCRRHGLVFGNEDESTRINKDANTGQLFASECRFDADGHSVIIGAPVGTPQGASVYRVHMRSIDSAGGPKNSSGLTILPSGWWVRGQNVIIENSAFNPGDSGGEGLIVSGRNVEIGATNRFLGLGSSTHAVRVLNWTSNGTEDLTINKPMVIGTQPSSAVVALDTNTSSPSAAVVANTVKVISDDNLNGTIMSQVDKELVSEYSDHTETRINTPLLSKVLITPSDNDFEVVESGVLDVSKSFTLVTGEGGTDDDLDTIDFNGGTPLDGMELTLMAGSSSQTITLKHATGNIRCGSDRALDNSSDCVVLKYKSTSSFWVMVSFSDNGA